MKVPDKVVALWLPVAMGMWLLAGAIGQSAGQSAAVQVAPQLSDGGADNQTLRDDLQRTIRFYNSTEAGERGPARGAIIYQYKCWVCHNKYTIAEYPGSAPYLADLSKGGMSDETVITKIKTGSSRMPAFGKVLSDADIADLLSYLRSPECCNEGENPPPNPWYRASKQKWSVPTSVSGGPRGVVRTTVSRGDPIEGIMVQLMAPNGVKTTVYTNTEGQYEFPKMQSGTYTLRIAKPLEFKPYLRAVGIDGATRLEDIVLEPLIKFAPLRHREIPQSLPATRDVEAQLSGAEILWNLPGTLEEKDTFRRGCGSGCHTYQQIFRVRYDERGWALLMDRMFRGGRAHLITVAPPGEPSNRGSEEDKQRLVKWLAKVRGPEAVDAPYYTFPRPRGASTRAVITEYEVPRTLSTLHDVHGDSQGNIWYASHRMNYFGKLDPRTGIVTEYATPPTPGRLVGTHRVAVDQKRNLVWVSENWAGKLTRFDPRTGEFRQFPAASSNFAIAPDGFIWGIREEHVARIDPNTGETIQKYDMQGRTTYDNTISYDGNYWAGSGPSTGGNSAQFLDIRTGEMVLLDMGTRMAGPSRGGFDPFGNAWFGGKNASFVKIDTKARRMSDYTPPTGYSPYTSFYEAMPDKNGEVWGGVLQGRGFVRYNPRTDRWIEYVLPEPNGHSRRTWIDNSTNPVTVWYSDFLGHIVRIQPLE